MKLIIFALIAYAIYILFFKKGGLINNKSTNSDDDSETMVECQECHTFVAIEESIKHEGKYYCSKECARLR